MEKEKVSEKTMAAPPTYLGSSQVSAKKNTVDELQPISGSNIDLEVSQSDTPDDDFDKKKEKLYQKLSKVTCFL